jgi:hypothetical protein
LGCSQSPHDVTTANLWLVKNVVEPQKFDQELRVSYKPTRFSGWVVDSTRKSTQKYMIEISDEDHKKMVSLILKSKAKIMLSGYDNDIYNKLVENKWNKLELESPNTDSDSIEYVWLNYEIPHNTKDIKEIFETNNNINNSKQLSLFC